MSRNKANNFYFSKRAKKWILTKTYIFCFNCLYFNNFYQLNKKNEIKLPIFTNKNYICFLEKHKNRISLKKTVFK
ncbi:MAG: hypothetical protein EAZ97_07270 [Bacteroidetes bacterium]|nr:MAG: hypothetical protein EAZ97_07270 [Bacteroidota bacterium]